MLVLINYLLGLDSALHCLANEHFHFTSNDNPLLWAQTIFSNRSTQMTQNA